MTSRRTPSKLANRKSRCPCDPRRKHARFARDEIINLAARNELPQNSRHCSRQCYIDNTKLFVSFSLRFSHRIVQEINEDLLQVNNWCFRNRLLLNPDKTKLIVFGSRQMTSKLREFHLSLVVKNISPMQSARD